MLNNLKQICNIFQWHATPQWAISLIVIDRRFAGFEIFVVKKIFAHSIITNLKYSVYFWNRFPFKLKQPLKQKIFYVKYIISDGEAVNINSFTKSPLHQGTKAVVSKHACFMHTGKHMVAAKGCTTFSSCELLNMPEP